MPQAQFNKRILSLQKNSRCYVKIRNVFYKRIMCPLGFDQQAGHIFIMPMGTDPGGVIKIFIYMKKKMLTQTMLAAFMVASASVASAQISESMGTAPSTETIAKHENDGDFDEDDLTYSGTGDVRNTTPSTGYLGASGLANVLLQAQETFEMGLINTNGCSTIDSIVFGVHKNTNAATGVDYLRLQYLDGLGVWTNIPFAALPTGTGTSKWYRRAVAIPAGAIGLQMRFRFINTLVGTSASNPQYRIDDISMGCASVFVCEDVPAAVLTAADPATFCAGGLVTLETSEVDNGIYTFYRVVNNGAPVIVEGPGANLTYDATQSGVYYTEQNVDGCTSESNRIAVNVYASPNLDLSFSPGTTVPGGTVVTASASLANAAPFFSQYIEGSEYNKYLEIYNPTNTTLTLSNFAVRAYHNGAPMSGTPTGVINLTGTLAPGAAYVIAHPAATAWTTGTPNLTSTDLEFNGNDALVLTNATNTVVYDIFGSAGNNPGSDWDGIFSGTDTLGTENRGFIRKPCVYYGLTTNLGLPGRFGFTTLVTEWDTLSRDTIDNTFGLGSHNYGIDFSWNGTNGSFVGGDNTGSPVQFTVGQQGQSVLTANVTGLCEFNNCNEVENSQIITIGGARSMAIEDQPSINTETYPNPFSTNVNIVVEVTEQSNITIDIVDMYGKIISVVRNTEVVAGRHSYNFDGSALPAGTYTARVMTGNTVKTVRLVKAGK